MESYSITSSRLIIFLLCYPYAVLSLAQGYSQSRTFGAHQSVSVEVSAPQERVCDGKILPIRCAPRMCFLAAATSAPQERVCE